MNGHRRALSSRLAGLCSWGLWLSVGVGSVDEVWVSKPGVTVGLGAIRGSNMTVGTSRRTESRVLVLLACDGGFGGIPECAEVLPVGITLGHDGRPRGIGPEFLSPTGLGQFSGGVWLVR